MNICLSGGSEKGILELGALAALEESHILVRDNIKKAVGTSIGAVILCSYIVGYSANDIFDEIYKTDTTTFANISLHDSIFNIDTLRVWIVKFIKNRCPNIETITTLEFYTKYNITFITSVVSLETGLEYISHLTQPDMKIIDQLISTISIPFIFSPHKIDEKTYIDGGILDNYSINMLDKNMECIGILIENQKMPYVHTGNAFAYIKRILDLIKRESYSDENTIILHTDDNSIINFNLNIDDKVNMFRTGYNLTIKSSVYAKYISKRHREKFSTTVKDLHRINEKKEENEIV